MITYNHVKAYQRLKTTPSSIHNQLKCYKQLSHLTDAIEMACDKGRHYVNGTDKKSPHLYRLDSQKLSKVETELYRRAADYVDAQTFEELYAVVSDCVETQFNNARLTKYEIAIRIGAFLGLEPTDIVYLHRGALDGAQMLGVVVYDYYTTKSDLVAVCPELQKLTSIDIEDILCLYAKDNLNVGCTKSVVC